MVRNIAFLLWLLPAIWMLGGCAMDRDDHLNGVWKQGYGFSNPNADRLRNGQSPTDF